MTETTRRNVLRYGIAIDLVILATGVGMLLPATPLTLILLFTAAVALSTWKGGWPGALTALILGAASLAGVFAFHANPLLAYLAASLAVAAGMLALMRPRPVKENRAPAVEVPVAPVLAFRVEAEREARERAVRDREEAERRATEEVIRERARLEAERQRLEKEMAERLELEREALRLEREKLEKERAERAEREERERAERERIEKERAEREAEMERRLAAARPEPAPPSDTNVGAPAPVVIAPPPPLPKPTAKQPSLLDSVTSWFKPAPARPRAINVTTARVSGNDTTTRRMKAPPQPVRRTTPPSPTRKPKLLLLERRRGTADTALPKLRQRGVDVQVVERWVDAVDELFRFRPDAICLDVEHPDFDRAHQTLAEKSPNMPVVLTGRSSSSVTTERYAAFVARPYDVDELARVAQQAATKKEDLLARQLGLRPTAKPTAMIAPRPVVAKPIVVDDATPNDSSTYEVACFSCRVSFNAVEADWCSCLAKERSLVCTNCLACFCKAPPAYKEKFWVEAPPRLFERKTSEARKQHAALAANPTLDVVQRPLVLAVEDDEEIQSIVHRVCTNLGYGFIYAMNGQDGFELAQQYRPNLILSDAFMPKLDGREMCRLLKEDPAFADTRMIVMTGLYTDTKYRSEALKRFHVDDYIAKPVAITDLINILQKHLEGVAGLPAPEDLHALHRKSVEEAIAEEEGENDVPLAALLDDQPVDDRAFDDRVLQMPKPAPVAVAKSDAYGVTCFNCQTRFDATNAEWCRCVGRDNTLVCEACGGCFCKAPAAYKERFWIDAPPSLFERKMLGSKRNLGMRVNPTPKEVKRPMILLVEDDENVQLIVRTVVTTMGYGFVVGANGQEGLSLAREYTPELILSDAFMPKLDGREMCRLLKEDPATARAKAIIMTGLYTDRKYRNEALDYFKVDDYVAKPLAVDDLIKLFKKHLPQEVAAH